MQDAAAPSEETEKHEEAPKEIRSFLRIEGARVYVADLLIEQGYASPVVLARFYGAREAVKAVASGLWLRKEVFFCRDEEVDGRVLERLEREQYVEGMEGMGRMALQHEVRYERAHRTIRAGVSMTTLVHPKACGQVTEKGDFFILLAKGENPVPVFIRAANRATTMPLPEDIGPDLWRRTQARRDITKLEGHGSFEGYSIRPTPDAIKTDIGAIIRARSKVVSLSAARGRAPRRSRQAGTGAETRVQEAA